MAKTSKGRGGTSIATRFGEDTLRLEHPATSIRGLPRKSPYGEEPRRGPKPVKLVAKQEE
jgi:hypothetical protein